MVLLEVLEGQGLELAQLEEKLLDLVLGLAQLEEEPLEFVLEWAQLEKEPLELVSGLARLELPVQMGTMVEEKVWAQLVLVVRDDNLASVSGD